MSRKSKQKTKPRKIASACINPVVPPAGNRDWIAGLILVLAVIAAYQPVWHAGFIWDDDDWTTNISGLLGDFSGLRLMWSNPLALQQYYPLTGTTFWLDYQLWGFWPAPYHVENVLLHAAAALLFWKSLQKLEVPGAWFAAGIFALHPVMVESVAWVTERKNVLSMVFFLGAVLAYGRFNSFWKEDGDSRRRWGAYALAFFLFFGALLAKTMTLSFPAVILLIGWWKNGRIRWRRDVLPTLPFFALAAGLSLVTAWLEKNHVGATGSDFAMSFPERCLVAGRAPWFYLGKLLWPENLCFVYPRWTPDVGLWWQWLFPLAALVALAALWLGQKKTGRGPAAAALFFVGTLFPVLGFMSAYGMLYSFVWDHWVYLSSLGFFALSTSAIVQTVERHRWPPKLFKRLAAALLLVLAVLTWRQCGMYADIETLWRTTIARNPACWMAECNLGKILVENGQVDEAFKHLQTALSIKPDYAQPYFIFGDAMLKNGRENEAIAYFQKGLAISPDFAEARNNLGYALLQQGRVDEASVQFEKALDLNPDYAEAHLNLGRALFLKKQTNESIAQFQAAIRIRPDYAEAHNNLGGVLAQSGRMDEAIVHFQMAVAIQPANVEAHNNLGIALFQKGLLDEAAVQFQKALAIQPDLVADQGCLAQIAWIMATSPDASIRNGTNALALARQVDQLSGGKNPVMSATLAAADAETGNFPEAITTARRALQLADDQKNDALAVMLQQEIKLYETGTPLREPKP